MARAKRPIDDGVFVGLRVSPPLRARIEAKAEQTGQSISDVVRHALETSLREVTTA